MTSTLLPSLRKEFRALLPTWVAAVVAVVLGNQWFFASGVLAYGLGAFTLGAQSIGHEYTHRTIGLMLSHPVDRRRLFLIKQGVLAGMLLALAAVASLVLNDGNVAAWRRTASLVLPVIGGMVLAPWLTMVTRNPLAGVVFGFSLPAVAFTAAELTGHALYRGNQIESARFALEAWFAAMAVLVPMAAVLNWRRFMHLEVIDGGGTRFDLPPWLMRDPMDARPRHPISMLARKELHLQQVTWVMVALYVVGWAVTSVTGVMRTMSQSELQTLMLPMSVVYFVALSLLIGSLASAEERQYGTIEWQMLMPIPAWRQWMVKVTIAVGLALVLGVGLPALLAAVYSSPDDRRGAFRMIATAGPLIVLLTSMSIYVSSLCSSGVRALAVSFPAMLVAVVFARLLSILLARNAVQLFEPDATLTAALYVSGAVLVALLLSLAFVNHRSADRPYGRIARQLVAIAAVVAWGGVLLSPL